MRAIIVLLIGLVVCACSSQVDEIQSQNISQQAERFTEQEKELSKIKSSLEYQLGELRKNYNRLETASRGNSDDSELIFNMMSQVKSDIKITDRAISDLKNGTEVNASAIADINKREKNRNFLIGEFLFKINQIDLEEREKLREIEKNYKQKRLSRESGG